MAWWQRLPAREIAFVLALLVATGLVGWAGGRTAVLTELLRPGWQVTASVVGGVKGGATYFQDLDHLRRDNAQLQSRLTEAEAELSRKGEVDAENHRLLALLQLAPTLSAKGVAARVIARSPNNWQRRLVIDCGTASGVGVDSAVLVPHGLIGRVLSASAHTAVVSLLPDPGQTVGILNQRSRTPGVLLGEGEPHLTIQYLPQEVDFRMGDVVVTSGYGGVYPKGVPVGRVLRVDQQPNAIVPKVTIGLLADLDRVEEVWVLPPSRPAGL